MRLIHVAVGVIVGVDGKILIAKRAEQAHQGGLWEFPGGKVEASETLLQALSRELLEELAITIHDTQPLIKIRHDYSDKSVLLDVHTITSFSGEPQGNEGQPILWVDKSELHRYEFPAANRPIITAINLPRQLLITGAADSIEEYVERTERALKNTIRLVQLRVPDPAVNDFPELVSALEKICQQYSAKLQLNISAEHFLSLGHLSAHIGLHLNTKHLLMQQDRPIEKNKLLSASCHNETEIMHAQKIGVDFILLSPVLATSSHPGIEGLGWTTFSNMIETVAVPVFALGGMTERQLSQAINAGAQGIAAISAFWN